MSQNNQSESNKWRDLSEKASEKASEIEAADESKEAEIDMEVAGAIDETSRNKLTDLINQLERDVEQYKNQALRAQAELDNVRRRLERDVQNAHKYGVERLISDLLPVMDGLMRGLDGTESDDPKLKTMRQGMELTQDLLQKVIEKNGVSEINPASGDAFDPAQHEAMSMQKNPNAKPNTILQVLQKGYALNGRVVRAAMVIVAS